MTAGTLAAEVGMELGHDTGRALATVVDLVNSGPERSHSGAEELGDLAALQSLVLRQEISEVPALNREDLATMLRLRERLHVVFTAPDERTAVRLVNALVADARTTPRLTDHGDWPMHIHYAAAGARLGERLAADCGMALALLIAAGERQRLATCAAPDCERVLVDLSRNRSKRYCESRTCGNRLHVAAYRTRQRTGSGTTA